MKSIPNPAFSYAHSFTNPARRPNSFPLRLSSAITLHSRTRKNLEKETKPMTMSANSHYTHQEQQQQQDLLPPLWTVNEIAEAVNGRIVKWGPPGTISTDTRTLKPQQQQWFFAIRGQKFDPHDFITPELSDKGCIGVVGNRVPENWDGGLVKFNGDSVASLTKMAVYARNRFDGDVIGVTGSAGKTTTKAMIALALGESNNVYESYGNRNNRIGVALSLIGIPGNAGIAVLEMGMSSKGEIMELARMARPTVRVIVNVGASHLENFESLEEVAMAKGEILVEANPGDGDVCVLNADDPLVMSLPVPCGVKKVLFGRRVGCDVRLLAAESANGGQAVGVVLEKDEERVEFLIPSPGVHLAMNACAAAAVATHLGVCLTKVGTCLSRFSAVGMRSEFKVGRNGIKIVNDAYNANPISTKAAIDLLKAIECNGSGKRVALLGDMLELGSNEIMFHEMILNHCLDHVPIDLIGLVGNRFFTAAHNLNLLGHGDTKKLLLSHDAQSLVPQILNNIHCNDVVLVKGSRGMEMERLVIALKGMELIQSSN